MSQHKQISNVFRIGVDALISLARYSPSDEVRLKAAKRLTNIGYAAADSPLNAERIEDFLTPDIIESAKDQE